MLHLHLFIDLGHYRQHLVFRKSIHFYYVLIMKKIVYVRYIHYDPKIWGDPETFRPERFLSPDGKSFKKHEALLAFSVGNRQCLGNSVIQPKHIILL
jgi:hypothetical protein